MQEKDRFLLIIFIPIIFFNCVVDREIKEERLSPNGNRKLILQSVDGGTATKHLNKIFVIRADLKLRNDYTPVLITEHDNIIDFSWEDENNIIIIVKSKDFIYYQVVICHGIKINVISKEI